MHMTVLTRKRTPFDGVPVDTFQEFATFLRSVAPRWLNGSRSLSRLMARRAGQRQAARGRFRGISHVGALAPAPLARIALRRRR